MLKPNYNRLFLFIKQIRFSKQNKDANRYRETVPQDAEAIPLLSVIAYQVGENKIATGLITQATEFNQYMFLTV